MDSEVAIESDIQVDPNLGGNDVSVDHLTSNYSTESPIVSAPIPQTISVAMSGPAQNEHRRIINRQNQRQSEPVGHSRNASSRRLR